MGYAMTYKQPETENQSDNDQVRKPYVAPFVERIPQAGRQTFGKDTLNPDSEPTPSLGPS